MSESITKTRDSSGLMCEHGSDLAVLQRLLAALQSQTHRVAVLGTDPDQVTHGLHHSWGQEHRRVQVTRRSGLILPRSRACEGFTRGDVFLLQSQQTSEDLQAAVAVAPPNTTCTGV